MIPSPPPPRLVLPGGPVLDPALLLAPMEGVTDPAFRSLVAETSPAGSLGATCTEFYRVTAHPPPVDRLRRFLGPPGPVPAGLQLMGRDPGVLAEAARRAAAAGAAFVDLNFGCPAPRVFQHGAGSALLGDPPRLQILVAAAVRACPCPVTVKIRAGDGDDRALEDIARRVEDAGAAALTVHARLRREGWDRPADWRRIARAVAAVSIPVVGNGGVEDAAGVDAMLAATGCSGVMVGRGALTDPWLFATWRARRRHEPPPRPDAGEVAAWVEEYARRMAAGGATAGAILGRVKQLLRAMARGPRLPRPQGLPPALRATEPGAALAAVGLPAGGYLAGGPAPAASRAH